MVVPENILNKMSRADREAIARSAGNLNAGRTADECRAAAMTRDEKTAQREIGNYLRAHGIEFINPPMNKRSTLPKGWPDFTFALGGLAVALEVKVWGQKPRPEQIERHAAMKKNGWHTGVVSCVQDVSRLLSQLELEGRFHE